jgi:hypothetical protein
LADRDGTDDPTNPRPKEKTDWVARCIGQLQRRRDARRTEKYHETTIDRASRTTARATIFIVIFTAIGACLAASQAIVSYRQLDAMTAQLTEMKTTRLGGDASTAAQMALMKAQAESMGGQLAEMRAQQRPWVNLGGPIAATEFQCNGLGGGIFLRISLNLKNYGHTPPRHIAIGTTIKIGARDVKKEAITACEYAEKSWDTFALFPGTDGVSFAQGVIPDTDIQQEMHWTKGDAFSVPLFTVCVAYNSPTDAAFHHSVYYFHVVTAPPSRAIYLLDNLPPVQDIQIIAAGAFTEFGNAD